MWRRIPKPRSITLKEWNDWHWQCAHAVSSVDALKRWGLLDPGSEREIAVVIEQYRMRITPYCMALISGDGYSHLRSQYIPAMGEVTDTRGVEDPKGEGQATPVPYVIKLHADRVMLCVTNSCPVFCRFCLRKSRCGGVDSFITRPEFSRAVAFIRKDKCIRDVLISGGDPFMFSDERIRDMLRALRAIKHVDIIRFGTRTISTLPQRITPSLAAILKKYHPVWVNTHINHADEITTDTERACDLLLSHGIPLGNQSVLLKGVNDSFDTMRRLVHALLRLRVRPYYLYHSNFVRGAMAFQTPPSVGKKIIHQLQRTTTGFAVPRYVISTSRGKRVLEDADDSGMAYLRKHNIA